MKMIFIFLNLILKIIYNKKIILILLNLYILFEKKKAEILNINNFFSKKNIVYKNMTSLLQTQTKNINNIKLNLLQFISQCVGKNITKIRQIFVKTKLRFGNQIFLISNIIFYCEILKCKRIILDKNHYWFIKNTIINKKYKMKIEVRNTNSLKYYDTLIDNTCNFYYYNKYLKTNSRVYLLRKEIYKNLPKVSIDINDLYIYIRSGDIFTNKNPNRMYLQPPFCFYMKVINDYNFRQIFLISENKNNPIINQLLKSFPYITYKKNSLKLDIAKLVNAYNVAGGGISTFFYNILSLNVKLKNLWIFQFNHLPFNLVNLRKIDIKNNIKNYVMNDTKDYTNKMYPWRNSKMQRKFMLNYNCTKFFFIS